MLKIAFHNRLRHLGDKLLALLGAVACCFSCWKQAMAREGNMPEKMQSSWCVSLSLMFFSYSWLLSTWLAESSSIRSDTLPGSCDQTRH